MVGPAVTIRASAAPRRAVRSRRCIVRPPELGRSGWAGRVGSADASGFRPVPQRVVQDPSATMPAMAHYLVEQLRFTRSEWLRGLRGVPEADGLRRFEPMNSIGWVVGPQARDEQ